MDSHHVQTYPLKLARNNVHRSYKGIKELQSCKRINCTWVENLICQFLLAADHVIVIYSTRTKTWVRFSLSHSLAEFAREHTIFISEHTLYNCPDLEFGIYIYIYILKRRLTVRIIVLLWKLLSRTDRRAYARFASVRFGSIHLYLSHSFIHAFRALQIQSLSATHATDMDEHHCCHRMMQPKNAASESEGMYVCMDT